MGRKQSAAKEELFVFAVHHQDAHDGIKGVLNQFRKVGRGLAAWGLELGPASARAGKRLGGGFQPEQQLLPLLPNASARKRLGLTQRLGLELGEAQEVIADREVVPEGGGDRIVQDSHAIWR